MSTIYNKFGLNYYVFILLVFLPSFPLFIIPGLYQPMRFDFILMAIHSTIFLLEIFYRKQISKTLLVFFIVGLFYIVNSRSYLVGSIQLLGYLSFFASFRVGFISYKNHMMGERSLFLPFLYFFIYFTLIVHILGILGLNLSINVGSENYSLLGRYGTFGMPFKFGLFLILLTFLISGKIIKSNILIFLLIAVGILSSDSRISLACFALVLFFINSGSFYSLLFLSPIALLISSPKMLELFNSAQSIGEDGSFLMRIVNFQNYLDWLNAYNFTLGQGALAFLEFGTAYGKPGPLDILSVRLFSEFGIPITVIAFIMFVSFLYRVFNLKFFMAFMLFFLAYSFFNEGVIALRTGNLFWFVLGIFYSKYQDEKNINI